VSTPPDALHPAQNRGFRELYAAARHVVSHYRALDRELGEPALVEAERAARRLLDELSEHTARHDLHGFPAAQNVGVTAARARNGVGDRFLERNQALRFAVDDVEHVTTLLAYMGSVSSSRGKKNLPELCGTWERKLRRQVTALRKAAVALGSHPDDAIEPLDPGALGKAAHGSAVAVGTVGEAVDKGVNKAKETTSAVKEKSSGFFDQAQNGETATEGEDKKRRGLFRRG
jgi:hypothetical protein